MMNKINEILFVFISFIFLTVSVQARADSRGESRQLTPYLEVMAEVATDFSNKHTDVFGKLLDQSALMATVLKPYDFTGTVKQNYESQLREIFKRLPEEIVTKIPANGYAKILRAKPWQQGARVLMRVDLGSLGYGYYDFLVSQDSNEKYRITDWFNYGVGQYYSESLQQLIGLNMPGTNKFSRLFDLISGRKQNQQQVEAFVVSMGQKDFAHAYEQYKAFSPELKKQRIVMVLVVQAANMSQDNQFYREALGDLAKYFADDPEMAFSLMDYYFLEQQYDVAGRIIDNLQRGFGVRDAAMMGMKANVLISAGHFKDGLVNIADAIKLEPSLENNYWIWMNGAVLAKDYVQAVKVVQLLEQNFGYDITAEALAEEAMYHDFLASAAFKNRKK